MYNPGGQSYHGSSYQTLSGMSQGVAVSTEGTNWNGNQWTNNSLQNQQLSAPRPPLPSTELPKIPAHLEHTVDLNSPHTTAARLTAFYSEVYQYWAAQVAACRTSGDTSSAPFQWAEYYSDLSSRAAHHYNNLTQNQSSVTSAAIHRQGSGVISNNNRSSAASSDYHSGNASGMKPVAGSDGSGPPDSFKGYAHRCLSQCTSETQKKAMKELIEMTIRKSLQDRSMHSKNWTVEPLLPVYSNDSIRVESMNKIGKMKSYANVVSMSHKQSPKNNHFSNTTHSNATSYEEKLPCNDSYYGRGPDLKKDDVLSSAKNKGKRPRTSKEQNLPANDSYYGSPIQAIPTSTPDKPLSKKQKKKMKQVVTMDRDEDDKGEQDYIALSSLSSDRYKIKNQKLVRLSSSSSSVGNKKQKNKIKEGFDATASKLASRANRFSGQGGISSANADELHSTYAQNIDRYMGKTVIGGASVIGKGKKQATAGLKEEDYERMTVKGRCTVLEKEYLRLTSPPKAELVRPETILKKHLSNLKQQWKQGRRKSGKINTNLHKNKKDYNWFCSQMKAIRQDLTVQRIFNAFAIDVYETHARMALEEGDLNEFNQSQTQLKELYERVSHPTKSHSYAQEKNANTKAAETTGLENENEFVAYRIIYHVLMTGNKKYEGGSTDLFKIMLHLTTEQRDDPSISHALRVRAAAANSDYHAFFRLQDVAPNMGMYLMDFIVPSVRATGLRCMMKAYRPTLSVKFILSELGFAFDGGNMLDEEEGYAWLKGCGCKFGSDRNTIVTKESVLDESYLAGNKQSSLI